MLQKMVSMVVNNALSRGLGNIAKACLMRCGQSTCAELKKFEFCPVGHGGIALINIRDSILRVLF